MAELCKENDADARIDPDERFQRRWAQLVAPPELDDEHAARAEGDRDGIGRTETVGRDAVRGRGLAACDRWSVLGDGVVHPLELIEQFTQCLTVHLEVVG